MDQEYLIGELSVRLERLQAAARGEGSDVVQLRHQVEAGIPGGLAPAVARALALADDLCWEWLSDGDTVAFTRQAVAGADLRLFGICSNLLTDE